MLLNTCILLTGKGRGRQVIAVARTSDLVIIMLDATKSEVQRDLLEKELESVGIRLNKRRPNIYFKVYLFPLWIHHINLFNSFSLNRKRKPVAFHLTQCAHSRMSVKNWFRWYYTNTVSIDGHFFLFSCVILCFAEIFNCEILFREDSTADELIDVIVKNRVYLPCLYVYNKIDQICLEEVEKLALQPHSVVVSCNMKLNLDYMIEKIWESLALIQVYTKKRGGKLHLTASLLL